MSYASWQPEKGRGIDLRSAASEAFWVAVLCAVISVFLGLIAYIAINHGSTLYGYAALCVHVAGTTCAAVAGYAAYVMLRSLRETLMLRSKIPKLP